MTRANAICLGRTQGVGVASQYVRCSNPAVARHIEDVSQPQSVAMNTNPDYDRIEPELGEGAEEEFMTRDPIGLTFISGIHESDLLSFMERARGLADEVSFP